MWLSLLSNMVYILFSNINNRLDWSWLNNNCNWLLLIIIIGELLLLIIIIGELLSLLFKLLLVYYWFDKIDCFYY